jgi:hypothetical protein
MFDAMRVVVRFVRAEGHAIFKSNGAKVKIGRKYVPPCEISKEVRMSGGEKEYKKSKSQASYI